MISSSPAGQSYAAPIPLSNTTLPAGPLYPTQFADTYAGGGVDADRAATAAVEEVASAHRSRTFLGQSFGFARSATEQRSGILVRQLLDEGHGYDWPQVLAPLAIGGSAPFVSAREYLGGVFRMGGNGNPASAAQTAMRARLSGLLCWARGLVAATDGMRNTPEIIGLVAATDGLLVDAEARLALPTSRWARFQCREVRAVRKLLTRRANAQRPGRGWFR